MGFLELRQETGVYTRVTAGMSIRNSSLFIEVRNLSRYEGVMSRNNACDVIKLWCVLIKHGCDALYRLHDTVHKVGVLSYL